MANIIRWINDSYQLPYNARPCHWLWTNTFPPIPGCPSYIRQYFILRQKGSVINLICNGLWLLYILLAEATFNHSDLREKRIKANDLSYNAICTCKLVYTRSAMGGTAPNCMDHSLTKFPSINQLFLNLYWHCRLVELQVKSTRYIVQAMVLIGSCTWRMGSVFTADPTIVCKNLTQTMLMQTQYQWYLTSHPMQHFGTMVTTLQVGDMYYAS